MSHTKAFPRPMASNEEPGSGQPGGLLLMLALRSNPTFLSVVRGAVERLTEAMGFPAEHCRAITRAVDEALTNIVRHGYGNRRDQPITLYFRTTQRRNAEHVQQGLEIVLRDRGPAVDASKFNGRPLDEIRPGGLGLHFIHQAMDAVEFSRKGLTNQLRLVKYLAQTNNAA